MATLATGGVSSGAASGAASGAGHGNGPDLGSAEPRTASALSSPNVQITSDIPITPSAPFPSSTPAPHLQGLRNGVVAAGAPSLSHHAPSNIVPRGFPSPGRDHKNNPKLDEDRNRLMYGIQQSIPEAVRRSVRDNWEKCLLGTDFHQAFVVSFLPRFATPLLPHSITCS